MKRKQKKHAFEMKAFADGWDISRKLIQGGWVKDKYPDWIEEREYVVDDVLVELRIAEKLGHTIEVSAAGVSWSDADLSNFDPCDGYLAKYRVKNRASIDFDFDCLPLWADKYISQDRDLVWYSFNTIPIRKENYWTGIGTDTDLDSVIPEEFAPKNYEGDWGNSLLINPKYRK